MEPLEVFALDKAFDRLTGSVPYTSLSWTRRFRECGEFSMTVPADLYSPEWAYVYTDERPETGIVQKVEYQDSSQVADGIDTVTVSGFFLESLLNRITFLVEQPETKTEKVYVEMPRQPFRRNDTLSQVYKDPSSGKYVYQDREGNAITEDGQKVDWSSSYEKVDYGGTWKPPWPGWDPSENFASTGAYTTDGGKTVTTTYTVGWMMGEAQATYDVKFVTDRGDYFYETPSGKLMMTTGVVDKKGDTYSARLRAWQDLASDGGGHYYTRTYQVKGPWQRTEMLEPTTVADPVQTLLKWVQRFMGASMLYVEPDFSAEAKALDPSLQLLGDLAYSTLNELGASFRVDYDFEHNVMIFSAYKGADRTQAQTALPWAVFSDTWGTMRGWTASRDESGYRNTAYVLYDYDEPQCDEAGYPAVVEDWHLEWDESGYYSKRVHDGWHVPYTTRRGYYTVQVGDANEQNIEAYLDKRDDPPECDSDWSRDMYTGDTAPAFDRPVKEMYEKYPDAIKAEGKQMLEQDYRVITTLETGTVDRDAYLRDFDLGDLVELVIEAIGVTEQARVTEVEETYEVGKADVTVTVGDQQLTWTQKARLV